MKLICNNLTKDYGGGKGLLDFSMEFKPGIYGILGPNGSGKSTMMNLLTDNVARTSGELTLDGADVLKMGESYRAKLGYMPQQQGFYPHFSPMAFLKYMAELKGLPKKEIHGECLRLLEAVNLLDVKDPSWELFRRYVSACASGPESAWGSGYSAAGRAYSWT